MPEAMVNENGRPPLEVSAHLRAELLCGGLRPDCRNFYTT